MLNTAAHIIDSTKKSKAHMLPCSIEAFNGKAPISDFFHYDKENNCTDLYQGHFHGRKLVGEEITLPDGINGFVYVKGNGNGIVETEGSFNKVILWEHDIAPDTIKFDEQMDWFSISDALHSNERMDNNYKGK